MGLSVQEGRLVLPSFLLDSAHPHNPHPHPQRAQSHFPYLVGPVTGCGGGHLPELGPYLTRKADELAQ